MGADERHYNIKTLNVIFAVASLLLLTALGAMFFYDYDREWKQYQQDFYAMEIEKTRVKYDTAIHELEDDPEYQEILTKLSKTEETTQKTCAANTDWQKEMHALEASVDISAQRVNLTKAEVDAAKFAYEEARVAHPEQIPQARKHYTQLKEKIVRLQSQHEKNAQRLKELQARKEQCAQDLKGFQQEQRRLGARKALLKRKLKTIDPGAMNFTNRIANLVRDLPVVEMSNPRLRVKQVVLKDITEDNNFVKVPKVDRCITCHLGIDDPDYLNAPQPLTTHPRLDLFLGKDSVHPLEEFGCTVCHSGRGRGTNFVSAAHVPANEQEAKIWKEKYGWKQLTHWEDKMYPMPYVEAGCFKCHATQPVIKEAPKLDLGLRIIERAGCYACHAIERYEDWPKPGPDLTKIADKIPRDWAYQWIADPHALRADTWMPAFFGQSNNDDPESRQRTQQEIHAIVEYLYAQSDEYPQVNMPHWGNAKRGKELVASIGCMGCHRLTSQPKAPTTMDSLNQQQGPTLAGLSAKTSKVWIYNWLKDPKSYHAETLMPNLRLNDQEAADIAAFLIQLGDTTTGKDVPPRDEARLNQIVLDFLQSTQTRQQAEAELTAMERDEKWRFAGKKLIAQYGCFSCHSISGFEKHKPIGTELTYEGSKSVHKLDFGYVEIPDTKKAWFTAKLKDPRIFDQHKIKSPDEKLRMPNYNLNDREVQAVVTALLGFVEDRPSPSKIPPRTPENLYIERGQELIRQFNCQTCHLIENRGGSIQPHIVDWLMTFDERSRGEAEAVATSFSPPNLVGEGMRVQPDWLFRFLHNPTEIRPWLKVRMPTYDFNTAHLNAFVKYFNALDDEEFPFSALPQDEMPAHERVAGKKLFSKDYFGCAQCHIVGDQLPSGSPDSWAPDFALARERLKPDWIDQWLLNPQDLLPGTKMPTYFDPEYLEESGPDDILDGDERRQIQALRKYILSLAEDDSAADQPPSEPSADAAEDGALPSE